MGRPWRLAAALLVLFPLASYSTEHHWDEYLYLYSTAHHAVGRLLSFEPALADGVFPNGFFSGKLAFVALLRGLMLGLGDSWTSILVIRGVFVTLCLMAAACAVGLVRTLLPRRRLDSLPMGAAVLASPVSLYLGFKTLSEVPALLFLTAACWAFADALDRGSEVSSAPSPARLLLAGGVLALATVSRVTALMGFVSFVAALPLLAERRFSLRRAWGWGAVLVLAQAAIVSVIYLPLGITPDRFRALAESVTGRTQSATVMVYALALTVQSLGILAVVGLRWPLPPRQRFALAWLALGAAPYVLTASYLEPRFFYATVPGFAMLVWDGVERVAGWVGRRHGTLAALAVLAALTLVNRAVLVPLMPFEIDEGAYGHRVDTLQQQIPGGTVLVPWLSDFCYLKLSRADARVVLTFSRTYGTGEVFSTREFGDWVGDSYAGSPLALGKLPEPWKYVGWTYQSKRAACAESIGGPRRALAAVARADEPAEPPHRELALVESRFSHDAGAGERALFRVPRPRGWCPVKVLFLAPQPFYIERGTPIAVRSLLRELSTRGWSVDLLTFYEGEDVDFPNVRIIRIPRVPGASGIGPGLSAKKLVCDAVLFFKALALAARGGYRYVHAVEEAAFMAAVLRFVFRVPYVYDMDSSMAEQVVEKRPGFSFMLPLLKRFEAAAVRGAEVVVPVCESLARIAEAAGAARTIVLTDPPAFSASPGPEAARVRKELGAIGTWFMYAGNLEPYQGIGLLLESFALAVKRGRDVGLVIVGGKRSDIETYQAVAARLGVDGRTRFFGPRSLAETGTVAAAADVLVSPRTTGVNTPMKVYAYLNSGKPILATDIESHSQVLSPEFALLAEASPDRFADGMCRLADDPALRLALADRAARVARERYSQAAYAETVQRFCALIESKTEA